MKTQLRHNMQILKRFDRIFDYVGVLLAAILSFMYFYMWLFAQPNNIGLVYSLAILLVFELFMIHSSILLMVTPRKFVVGLFILLFGGFVALLYLTMPPESVLLSLLYISVVLIRMRYAFFPVYEDVKRYTLSISIFAVLLCIVLILVLSYFSPYISEFNLDRIFRGLSKLKHLPEQSTLVLEHGNLIMCFGFLYFGIMSLFKLSLVGAISVEEDYANERVN